MDMDLHDSDSQPLAYDRLLHAMLGRVTGGLSPATLGLAYLDWLFHLGLSPGKQAELVHKAQRKLTRFGLYASHAALEPDCPYCIEPLPQDNRFRGTAWQQWPYNLIHQGFLLTQQWWYNATTGVPGVEPANENTLEFSARQWLDLISPSNFLLTNPELLERTLQQGGANLLQGLSNWIEDWERDLIDQRPLGTEQFRVGQEVAVTPGKVVYRNELIELIQYAPQTDTVWREPLLIVPAWIMKYYILDLSPHNSLVKYLVEQGHTVFIISWKNPTSEDRHLGMEDYRRLGVMAALDAISRIVPDAKIHTAGYCLGGTLLSIAAATMAREEDDRLASITLLAAQVDFTEAGELKLFISESQVAFLEDIMWEKGYLDAKQMAGAFILLRSKDLLWSRMVQEYLAGERNRMNDLMAWNTDTTRMPYRMHSEYLRKLFLNNDLAEGRYRVEGRPILFADIRVPILAVGATKDHVAPWKSVYKLRQLSDAQEFTFLLTAGGHNAGIVSEPGHPRRSYQIATHQEGDNHVDPDAWVASIPSQEGSWWPEWSAWLAQRSSERGAPPPLGNPAKRLAPLQEAPGSYVLQP